MTKELYDHETDDVLEDNFEYDFDDEDDEPLFSTIEIVLFSIVFLTGGVFSLYVFKFFNHNFIKIFYLNDYNEPLLALLSMEFTMILITAFTLWFLHYRLYHYSYETLFSYLGFHKPNWKFLVLWTTIFISIHSLSWTENARETHLVLSERILNYGIWTTLLGTVIIAPICEEILIRGFLWRATLERFQSEKMAFMVSSTVFALAHYKFESGFIIFYFISSWILLRARLVGGTLAFAIFLHFLHNFAIMLETLVIMSK